MRACFITGTDTAVGKTLVSVSLAAYFSLREGLRVGVMKPFETGLPADRTELFPCDAKSLKEASGSSDDLSTITPFTFELPLAPETASILEHKEIDLGIVNRAFQGIVDTHDITIVEGAGGIMVPIKDNFFFADLIRQWALPAIVVSRLGLGAINHTLLTCRALQSLGVTIIGVILNDMEGKDEPAARTNPEILKKYLTVPILGIYPTVKDTEREALDRELCARNCAQYIDTKTIFDGALFQAP